MQTYNDRLFSQIFRKDLHFSRFYWLQRNVKGLTFGSIIELGCFDAKTLDFLPKHPFNYTGLDEGWEGGLAQAQKKYSGDPSKKFILIHEPEEILDAPSHDLSICLETIEHLPIDKTEEFIKNLSLRTKSFTFFSIPNESGVVFFVRHLLKVLFRLTPESYTLKEVFWQTLGYSHKVERLSGSHKGFDYKKTIDIIRKYYNIEKVEAIPFSIFPVSLGFNIGIVAKKK